MFDIIDSLDVMVPMHTTKAKEEKKEQIKIRLITIERSYRNRFESMNE